jgi:hypothetical protein
MALILAIEPDRRQAAQLTSLIRARVGADLVLAETTEQALSAIGDRVPDLVLVPALLAPQDDATLAGALRVIAAAARIQMLTIPVLAATSKKNQPRGVLAKWRRRRTEPTASEGCDPAVFADQIAAYLAEAAAERAVNESDRAATAPADVSMEIPTAYKATGVPAIVPLVADPVQEEIVDVTSLFITEERFITEAREVSALHRDARSVDQPQDEAAVETMPIEDVADAPGGDPVEVWAPPSFVARHDLEDRTAEILPELERDASSFFEELPIAEVAEKLPLLAAPISAAVLAHGEAALGDPPMAVDAISLFTPEDAWDTEDQTEFFLSEFSGGEPSADDPAVYELQIDDLSTDVLSLGEPSFETPPQNHSPAMDMAPLVDPAEPRLIEPWMQLPFGTERIWPGLEGMVSEPLISAPVIAEGPDLEGDVAETVPESLAPELVEAPLAAAATAVAAGTAPASRPEWLELIESLRRDVERLRGDGTQPLPVAAAARDKEAPRTAPAVAGPLSSKRTPAVVDVATKGKKGPEAKPAQDEWGFFDPEQCGFAALLAKLDEITPLNDAP